MDIAFFTSLNNVPTTTTKLQQMTWNAVGHHFHQCTKRHRKRNITPFLSAGTLCMCKTEGRKFPNTCCILPFSFSSFPFRHFSLKCQFFLRQSNFFTIFSSFLKFSNYETSKDSEKDWHTSFPPSLFSSPSFRGVKIQIVFLLSFFLKIDLGFEKIDCLMCIPGINWYVYCLIPDVSLSVNDSIWVQQLTCFSRDKETGDYTLAAGVAK